LGSVRNWNIEADRIVHEEGKYFSVIATDVTISSREVSNWCQPMIEPAQQGLCAFVAKRINGVIHLIVQAKLECGNFDIIELAPTVQCLTGNYQNEKSIATLPFLQLVLSAQPDQIVFDVMQSEEGGRFFREQNRNLLVFAPENMEEELPEGYIWMNLKQVQTFIQFNNYFNIQARNLLATLSFTDEYA
jgi:oxidase EvaA